MCGIAGLMVETVGRLDRGFAQRASELLGRRGPDDVGVLTYSRAGVNIGRDPTSGMDRAEAVLVHRRLSILDVTEAGWQPMGSPDGRYYIVFNGEIYNYIELRDELSALGHTFSSGSDTEVLLAAYCQWGRDAIARFIGMFAFAILDTRDRTLFLARDFFGIKPLYYMVDNGRFAFASEIKTLLEATSTSRQANPQEVYRYLRHGSGDSGEETMFSGIKQLPSACFLEVPLDDLSAIQSGRYWGIDLDEKIDISFEDASQHLRELFIESVGLHLRSDVPVGTALSGGIDSSAIVATMRHLQGQKLDLHTFSFVAADHAISEERWMDVMNDATGAIAHKVRAAPDELASDLEQMVYVQDVPFGSTSIYAQYRVFQLAREAGIKVMLDGQGADELLAGYRHYFPARLAALVRRGRWVEATRFLDRASKWPGASKKWLLAFAGEFLLPASLQGPARRLIGKEMVPSWMNSVWFRERGVHTGPLNYTRSANVLKEYLLQSLTTQGLPSLLRYEDRNSMAFSIESRVPFLTPKLTKFVFSLPDEYLIDREGLSKAVFRSAMRGIVPDPILDRRDKLGFVTPMRQWLMALDPWVRRTLRSDAAARIPAIDLDVAESVWEACKTSSKAATGEEWRVWRWLNLIEWTRRFEVTYAQPSSG